MALALWSLGADIRIILANCGEIDIMGIAESLGAWNGTLGLNTAYKEHFEGEAVLQNSFSSSEKDKIEWYVDDKKYFSISASEMEGQPYPFNNDQFFIINCAVGGNWPGSPNNSTIFPQRFFVDYIRVFQKT